MDTGDAAALSDALERINAEGDTEAFISLMADDMVWTGVPRGILWWRRTPM